MFDRKNLKKAERRIGRKVMNIARGEDNSLITLNDKNIDVYLFPMRRDCVSNTSMNYLILAWFICLTACQSFTGYLMLKPDSW